MDDLEGTRLSQLLELVAVTGELPIPMIDRLGGGKDYREKIVRKAKQQGLVKVYDRDDLAGLRLTTQGRKMVAGSKPHRFSQLRAGSKSIRYLPSRADLRVRLFRQAETLILMYRAGVEIFRDRKPSMVGGEINRPVFYTSVELKEMYGSLQKIRNSRSAGLLLTPWERFVVYNMGPNVMRWLTSTEQRVGPAMAQLLGQSDSLIPRGRAGQAILLANSMECFSRLREARKEDSPVPLDGGCFRNMMWIPNCPEGEVQVKLLCDRREDQLFRFTLNRSFRPLPERRMPMEVDALDERGQPVLYCYDCNAPRLHRFLNACRADGYSGSVLCFDYQEEIIRSFCGKNMKVLCVDFETTKQQFKW